MILYVKLGSLLSHKYQYIIIIQIMKLTAYQLCSLSDDHNMLALFARILLVTDFSINNESIIVAWQKFYSLIRLKELKCPIF